MPSKNFARRGTDTFAAVLRDYEASPSFTTLAPASQAAYRYILSMAEASLGKFSATDPINGIRPKLVQEMLDGLADKPGTQKLARAVLKAVDSWAAPRERLCRPITLGTEIIGIDGGHEPWTDPQVAIGEKHSELSRCISLMAHLGQRGSDTIRMRLNDIEEHKHPLTGTMYPGINVTQQKTGLRLWVPFTEPLIELMREWRREITDRGPPWLLVTKPSGEPYTRRTALSNHWNAERDARPELAEHKDKGLVLHGLRGTCVVRYRKKGNTTLEIGSMIGMSEPMVTRYSRFADRVGLAVAAVHRIGVRTTSERDLNDRTGNEG